MEFVLPVMASLSWCTWRFHGDSEPEPTLPSRATVAAGELLLVQRRQIARGDEPCTVEGNLG